MSRTLIEYKNYVAGWLNASIHDFLEVIPQNAQTLKYSLITQLDSNPRPAQLLDKSPELKLIRTYCKVLGDGILLPTAALLRSRDDGRIFFGFDEVWFFPSGTIEPKPASASLVGPPRLNPGRLNRLGDWMSMNDCSVGLGDGEGLNFVVKAHGLVKYFLGYSIEQPQPHAV